jgi:hypothetical protein
LNEGKVLGIYMQSPLNRHNYLGNFESDIIFECAGYEYPFQKQARRRIGIQPWWYMPSLFHRLIKKVFKRKRMTQGIEAPPGSVEQAYAIDKQNGNT